ncbi:MAG: hypothetical protein HY885_16935 [Deltaproteobacteria bacterium]|nr:hypothetical protein [Deltaproteobacteria bacterium]
MPATFGIAAVSIAGMFIAETLPDEVETVDRSFRSKGAYTRFKALLEKKGMLEAWYKYEDARRKEALREWCSQENIRIE